MTTVFKALAQTILIWGPCSFKLGSKRNSFVWELTRHKSATWLEPNNNK